MTSIGRLKLDVDLTYTERQKIPVKKTAYAG